MTALETSMARPERRFTVEEYLRMVKLGILTDHDKVELIEGRIVEKMPRNPPHEASLRRLSALLMGKLPAEWVVQIQATIRLGRSAPEPDISVLRGPIDRYDRVHPQGEDVALVVEVADSSLQDDRHFKVGLYAGAGIPVYWIVNLVDRRVEVYTEPTGPDHFPAYRVRRDFPETATVALGFPGGFSAELSVASMLPARNG